MRFTSPTTSYSFIHDKVYLTALAGVTKHRLTQLTEITWADPLF